MQSKLLFLIVFLIPIQKRFAKFFRDFANSLVDPTWELPAVFEKNIGIFTTDIPLLLLAFFCLKRLDWKTLFFEKEKKFLTAFLAACLFSILASTHPSYALYYFRFGHLLLPAFLFYYLASFGTETLRRSIFFAVFTIALFQCGVALFQYFRQDSLGLKLLGEVCLHSKHVPSATFPASPGGLWLLDSLFGADRHLSSIIRAYGTLPHPNIFGGFLVMSLIMTYDLFMKTRAQSFARLFVGAAAALQIFVLFLTFSRSALFAWMGGSILWFVCALFRKEKILSLGSTIALAAVASLILLLPPLTERGGVVNYNQVVQVSDQGRIVHQNTALDIIRDHPFFGVGFYNYFLFEGKYSSSAIFSFVHNIYLYLTAETGIVGLGFFGIFIGCVLWRGWQKKWEANTAAPLAIFCAFLAIGLTDFYLIFHQQGRMMLFLVAGLVCMRSVDPLYDR